jgi:hypothetical protein
MQRTPELTPSAESSRNTVIGNPVSRRAFATYLATSAFALFTSALDSLMPIDCYVPTRSRRNNPDLSQLLHCSINEPLMRCNVGVVLTISSLLTLFKK